MKKTIATVTPIGAAPSRKARGSHPSTARADKQIVSADAGGIEASLPRDRWDRPLIIPPGGGDPVAYRRASTVAEVLEDHYGLHQWQKRLTAEGLAQRPDLVAAIHLAKSKTEVGGIVEQAMEHAGASVASRNGSTLHSFIERLNKGDTLPRGVPANIRAMCKVYAETVLKDWEVLDQEVFVVQDKIKVAGTYDARLKHKETGLIVAGDNKTGQNSKYLALKTPAQVAVYASGQKYDLDGDRTPTGMSRDHGLLIHLPWVDEENSHLAECNLHWLDLRIGRKFIMEAFRVERMRAAAKPHVTMPLYKGTIPW